MGSYIKLIAKPGCEDQINDAYAAMTGKKRSFLIYSEKIISREIAYIRSPRGRSQAHLRPYLKTTEDWNNLFPVLALGTGQFKVSGIDDDDAEQIARSKRDIAFILDHRMLFAKIEGLDDAREEGLTDFKGDMIEANKTKPRPQESALSFLELPRGRSVFYRRCIAYGRPDLWKAYVEFEKTPNNDTWRELRQKVVPWNTDIGLWGTIETMAAKMDGQDFGLMGRFRDGNVPSLMLVRRALNQVKLPCRPDLRTK